jgi:predicted SAM-dependent methyltransferase
MWPVFRALRFELIAWFRHKIGNSLLLRRQLETKRKLHFGSGTDIKPDFINIDMNGLADIFLDARNTLNIPAGSIEYIYSSHFVEHLEHDDLLAHLRECHRVLQSGGVLRLAVPDFGKVFSSYCSGDKELLDSRKAALGKHFGLPADLICAADFLNKAVYESGQHKVCLDLEKIRNLLIFCGFAAERIDVREFDPKIDIPGRRELTFFVEACK